MALSDLEDMEEEIAREQVRRGYTDEELVDYLVEYVESDFQNYNLWRKDQDERIPRGEVIRESLNITITDAVKTIRLMKKLDE